MNGVNGVVVCPSNRHIVEMGEQLIDDGWTIIEPLSIGQRFITLHRNGEYCVLCSQDSLVALLEDTIEAMLRRARVEHQHTPRTVDKTAN